jgi:hypothetical protein
MMGTLGLTFAAATTFTAATLGLAGIAAAAPTGGGNAADAVSTLQAQGYSVQINGSALTPLSECIATGVHGVPNSVDSSAQHSFTTVYVDVSCPSSND